jgi:hypothetical protein
MRIDALAIRLRPRTAMEAADLGVRLCQRTAAPVYTCYAVVAVPVLALALASSELAAWLPPLAIWWVKPWMDRTILFVLSRAAFGQETTVRDLWREQWQVWWRQVPFTLTVRRFSLWRSLTEPVYTLEGLSIRQAHSRVRQIRKRNAGAALLMTQAFSAAETALVIAVVSLVFWLAPSGTNTDLFELLTGEAGLLSHAVAGAYALVVLFLEPFYVAAGFAMYLNRRAELEAWDIEQEFRRAFAA